MTRKVGSAYTWRLNEDASDTVSHNPNEGLCPLSFMPMAQGVAHGKSTNSSCNAIFHKHKKDITNLSANILNKLKGELLFY